MGEIDKELEDNVEMMNTDTPKEQVSDLIVAISKFISQDHVGEITFLIPENVIGIEEALVYQQRIESIFGFRIDAVDKLILTKCIYCKSIDGRLIGKKIEALEAVQAQIQARIEPTPNMMEQLLGQGG